MKNVSIDMKSCYSASFKGEGKAKSYNKRFGHPVHRISIRGALASDITTGIHQSSRTGVQRKNPQSDPAVVWEAFPRQRLGANIFASLLDRVG